MRFDLKPKTKGRPRFVKGRVITPKTTKDFEDAVGWIWRSQGKSVEEGPVSVRIELFKDHLEVTVEPVDQASKLRGDADNYAKAVLDGLNGVAFVDDKQVVELTVVKAE